MSHRKDAKVWRIEAVEPQGRTNVVLVIRSVSEAAALTRFWVQAREAVTPWGSPVKGEWPTTVTALESEPAPLFEHNPKGA